jgi:hypothetical protein
MALCRELTRAGDLCSHKATCVLVGKNGAREPLCTLHANLIDPTRKHRKWESIPSAEFDSHSETRAV